MAPYRHILLVVDLTEDSLAIGRKAQALAQNLGAAVELLHVVEFVPVEPMGETLMPAVQMEDELVAARGAAPGGARRRTRIGRGRVPRGARQRQERDRAAWRANAALTSSSSAAANVTGCRSSSISPKTPCCMPRPATYLPMRAGKA